MAITLYHHPFTRAANSVWMLEETGVPYELKYVDLMAGQQKDAALTALNPMGKLPILQDGKTVVTESAAIGIYLADRYASGRLAPALDDESRGTYLRWSFFAPSVIEPGAMAKAANWTFRESNAGFGNYQSMLDTMRSAIVGRNYILGDTFSMADVIFGGTIAYMLQVKLIDAEPAFAEYVARLEARPARQRANAINAKVVEERGLARR